jgi:hypothetical protein
MASPIPIFSLGALVAPAATPLYQRLEAAGRLLPGGSEVAASPWNTNIIPAGMTRETLFEGLRWLCAELYAPANFGRRLLRMIEMLPPAPDEPAGAPAPPRPLEAEALIIIEQLMSAGTEERRLLVSVLKAIHDKPWCGKLAMAALFRYAQVRCLYACGGFVQFESFSRPEPLTPIAPFVPAANLASWSGGRGH